MEKCLSCFTKKTLDTHTQIRERERETDRETERERERQIERER